MSNYNKAITIVDKIFYQTKFTREELQPLIDYLNKSKTTEKEHEALKRDIARYFELIDSPMKNIHETSLEQKLSEYNEFLSLKEKLSKVGKKE